MHGGPSPSGMPLDVPSSDPMRLVSYSSEHLGNVPSFSQLQPQPSFPQLQQAAPSPSMVPPAHQLQHHQPLQHRQQHQPPPSLFPAQAPNLLHPTAGGMQVGAANTAGSAGATTPFVAMSEEQRLEHLRSLKRRQEDWLEQQRRAAALLSESGVEG